MVTPWRMSSMPSTWESWSTTYRQLIFNTHATVKKANNTQAFLSRNIKSCSHEVKEASYFVYVCPTIEYAATAWDPNTKKNTSKVKMVQRGCAHFVTGDYRQTSSFIYAAQSWMANTWALSPSIKTYHDVPHPIRVGGHQLGISSWSKSSCS